MPWPRRRALDASELATAASKRPRSARQRVDETVRGRTGADPDDAVIAQPRFDQCDRRVRRGAFECIGAHRLPSFSGRSCGRCRTAPLVWRGLIRQRPFVLRHAFMLERYVKKILASRVYDVAMETPLHEARGFRATLRNRVFLKREDLQTGVFVQAARSIQQDGAALDGGSRARRDLRVGRQSCAGRRARGESSRHSRAHRHGPQHAGNQSVRGARSRREE